MRVAAFIQTSGSSQAVSASSVAKTEPAPAPDSHTAHLARHSIANRTTSHTEIALMLVFVGCFCVFAAAKDPDREPWLCTDC